MEAKVITKQEFQPIVIELTIESEHELCDLWHRLEVGTNNIKASTSRTYLKHEINNSSCDNLYNIIDNLVEQNNLKL